MAHRPTHAGSPRSCTRGRESICGGRRRLPIRERRCLERSRRPHDSLPARRPSTRRASLVREADIRLRRGQIEVKRRVSRDGPARTVRASAMSYVSVRALIGTTPFWPSCQRARHLKTFRLQLRPAAEMIEMLSQSLWVLGFWAGIERGPERGK